MIAPGATRDEHQSMLISAMQASIAMLICIMNDVKTLMTSK